MWGSLFDETPSLFTVDSYLWEEYGTCGEDFNKCLPRENCVLMQFTGLLDKNGKEIYEGDIIRYTSFDGLTYTQECPEINKWHFWQETEDNDSVEVIGNIYENPELLKL